MNMLLLCFTLSSGFSPLFCGCLWEEGVRQSTSGFGTLLGLWWLVLVPLLTRYGAREWSLSIIICLLQPGSDSGTTAVVALIRGKQLIVANAGDSRCVVSEGGKAVDMSYDHKPEDEVELARIKNAGGKVTMDGRVNGGLNLSRAIGEQDRGECWHAWPQNAVPRTSVLPGSE